MPSDEFRRDRLTWIASVLLAWFAFLQAAPGLVIAHLRDELHLSYSTGGLHVAAFAAGSMVAGVMAARLERGLGLGNLFPMGISVAVALAPARAALASGRAVVVTSFAVLLAPLTVGTLADTTSLTAALAVVPVVLAFAAAALTLVRRAGARASGAHGRAARAAPSDAP